MVQKNLRVKGLSHKSRDATGLPAANIFITDPNNKSQNLQKVLHQL